MSQLFLLLMFRIKTFQLRSGSHNLSLSISSSCCFTIFLIFFSLLSWFKRISANWCFYFQLANLIHFHLSHNLIWSWRYYSCSLSWIQSFQSPRLVVIPRLKSPICPAIYGWIDTFREWNTNSFVQDLSSGSLGHSVW